MASATSDSGWNCDVYGSFPRLCAGQLLVPCWNACPLFRRRRGLLVPFLLRGLVVVDVRRVVPPVLSVMCTRLPGLMVLVLGLVVPLGASTGISPYLGGGLLSGHVCAATCLNCCSSPTVGLVSSSGGRAFVVLLLIMAGDVVLLGCAIFSMDGLMLVMMSVVMLVEIVGVIVFVVLMILVAVLIKVVVFMVLESCSWRSVMHGLWML